MLSAFVFFNYLFFFFVNTLFPNDIILHAMTNTVINASYRTDNLKNKSLI